MIGAMPVVALDLRFAVLNVPCRIVPAQFPGEDRVCNLMLASVQWSTANVPAGTRKQQYRLADDKVLLTGDPFGPAAEPLSLAVQPRSFFDTSSAEVLSHVERGHARGRAGARRALASHLRERPAFGNRERGVLAAAGEPLGRRQVPPLRRREACHGQPPRIRRPDFVVAFNEEISQPRDLRLSIPAKDVPLSEASILTRDGIGPRELRTTSSPVPCRPVMRCNTTESISSLSHP